MEKWECNIKNYDTNKKNRVLVLEKTIGGIDTVYEGEKIYIIRDTYTLYGTLRILLTLISAIFSFLMGINRHNETSILWFFISLSMLYTVFLEHRYIKVNIVLAKDFEKKYKLIKKDYNVITALSEEIKKMILKR
ncbi:MAG: hypothetical protein ACOCRK_00835 [bacterium]